MADLGSAAGSKRKREVSSGHVATMTMLETDSDLRSDTSEGADIAPFAPGYLLAGRWKIIDRIGKGGFGFVYSARDTELEATVAIKVLRPEHETSAKTIQQFKKEIQLARQVTHKNVCRIYDVGFYEQGRLRVPFLSMELLSGEPLDQRLHNSGALSIEEVEVIALQVAAALEAAHNVGIVHADLKPANIMVVGTGASLRAVVADFGLASAHATASRKEGETRVVGTPAYMAPEQVEGEVLGPAADFYALGCTLYQLISGHLPFHADTPVSTARARLVGPPPSLGDLSKTIHSRWVFLVRDLMTVDPAARLASASQLRKRLRKPRRAPFIALTLIALALVTSLSFHLFGPGKPPSNDSDLVLSLPTDPETLRLYNKGLEQWETFNLLGAIDTWQGAIDAGHRHARLYMKLCQALGERYLLKRMQACLEDTYLASKSLSKDEQRFYDAYRAHAQNKMVAATKSLSDLLSEHQGDYEIRLLLAALMLRNREYAEALNTLNGAKTANPLEKVRLDAAATGIYIAMMDFRKAIEVAHQVLPAARTHRMRREEILVLEVLAHAHRNLGNLDETEYWATQTIKMAEELGFLRLQALGVSHLGAVAIKRGHFKEAADLVSLRRSLLEDNNDLRAATQMSITHAENMAATGQPEQAYDLLTKTTIPQLRKEGNIYWEAYAKVVLAEIQRSLNRNDDAIDDCDMASSLFRSLKNDRLEAFAQMVCAETLLVAGRLDEARELLKTARATRTKLKLDLLLLQNSLLDAELLLREHKAKEAFAKAKEVADEYAMRKLPRDEVVALELSARAALAMGDQAEAEMAVAKARSIGTVEYLELEIALRFTELQVQAAGSSRSSVAPALEALRSEAYALGYFAVAERMQRELESP